MACPGSPAVIDELPESFKRSSVHADLGTAAHTLVETCLTAGLEDCRQYADYWIHLSGIVQRNSPPLDEEGDPIEYGWFFVDDDMMSAVDVMLETVWAEKARLGPMAELGIETRFDLSWLRPEMFGTSDASVSLFLGELVVIDYKHGQGVPVEVCYRDDAGRLKPNSQLAYYALGVAKEYDFTHEEVTLIVVQPRCPHHEGGVRRFSFPMSDLIAFRDELAVAVDTVHTAEDEYRRLEDQVDWLEWEAQWLRPGDHCKDSFCPKLGVCPAAYRKAQELAAVDFADDPFALDAPIPEDDMHRLSQLLKWSSFLDGLVKAVKTMGMRAKVDLKMDVPEHKIVRAKSNRSYVVPEEDVVAAVVGVLGRPQEEAYAPRKLKSPAQLEKMGKEAKRLVNGVKNPDWDPEDPTSPEWTVAPLALKRPGKLVLAHVDDPREEVSADVADDFDDDYASEGGEE
jgi:hypothetical protein